ncbi:MAG TPA: hypothetical protein VF885_22820 [Arthrobacter sp.]
MPELTAPETTTLPCAVCRKALERMDASYDIPYAANIFVSYGHEGATAYDSPGGEHLELLICTDCLDTMKAAAAIDRVLHATAATPAASNPWGSAADPRTDNPWNKQRLRNEFAMMDFLDEAPEGMDEAWGKAIFDACREASRTGRPFDPASVPAPAGQPTQQDPEAGS